MCTVYISDLHIPYTSRDFLYFTDEYILTDRVNKVVFVGDIVDSVRCSLNEIAKSKQGKKLLECLDKIIDAKITLFINGNHDPDLHRIIWKLLQRSVSACDVYIDRYLCVTHGYQFDTTCKYWNWKILRWFARWFYKPPSEWKRKNREKWHKSIGGIYASCYDFLEHHRDYKWMVIGHTHFASIAELESGQLLCDCGDWIDSLTWIEQVGSRFYLKRWREKNKQEL